MRKTIKTTLTSTGDWVKTHARMHSIIALLVFAVGLAATVYYWGNLRQSVHADMEAAYHRQMNEISTAAGGRLVLYQNLLRSAAGLFKITGLTLTQSQWVNFNKPYDIAQNFPDVEGIGASRYLQPDEVESYLERRYQQGDTNFKIFPEGERSAYVPVTFNAQYAGNNGKSRGYDGYAEPVRRKAMDYAIDSGEASMSGPLTLISESRPNRQSFILYMPIYKDGMPTGNKSERRAAILGFAYMAIDARTLLDSLLATSKNDYIAVKMVDAEQKNGGTLYKSDNFDKVAGLDGAIVDSRTSTIYGHKWHITLAASPSLLPARERQLPQTALWRGLVTCIFFSVLVWYLITDRERKYARQKQEEVQTAKDDLLSLASHQLRTPATVVKQYVGMLLQGYAGDLTKQQMEMLENAYESNERQLEIINQLLYVARLDADRIKLRCEKTDITKLLRDTSRDQSQTIAERQQQLTMHMPKQSLYAEIDPHYMRMVFDNLLSNAIKYTPEGGSITLSVRRAGGYIIVRVTDTGVGIDPSLQSTVFEKFTRVENELSNDVNGSGVGLYLTQKIVQLHGGSIEVKSSVGKGSTFTVRMPIKETKPISE